MATKKKLLQAAAGSAGGAGALNVEDVFSTYLYEGNGDTQAIENGINLGQSNYGKSIYFPDGDGDYLATASLPQFTGVFTFEFWFYSYDSARAVYLIDKGERDTNFSIQTNYLSDDQLFVKVAGTSFTYSTAGLDADGWNHIAVVRDSSNNVATFVNGTRRGSPTAASGTVNGGVYYIGSSSTGTSASGYELMYGHMSSVRISDNERYSTSSTSITVPTSEFTSDSNTVLLLGQGNTPLADASSNSYSVTVNGNPRASEVGPFDADEAGEGGLVWIKSRTNTAFHHFIDTERGADKILYSNSTAAEFDDSSAVYLTSFNSNGFSLGTGGGTNNSTADFASWTFRKAPKFFDVVTYTGDGVAGRTVSHNLGSVPGCIIIKQTNTTRNWAVYHSGIGNTKQLELNTTDAAATDTHWNNTTPTDTEFTLGINTRVNENGGTYVAYLFAHNDGDGEFGPDGDADIIKCGSYTGTGSSGHFIDLGFEPQWLLIKNTGASESWIIQDNMRSMTDTDYAWLYANGSNNEAGGSLSGGASAARPTGFEINLTGANINASGNNYIYIAIRRGPMAVPTDATDVFGMDFATSSGAWTALSGFPIDFLLYSNTTSGSDNYTFSRLNSPNYMKTNNTAAETGYTVNFDRMDGIEFPTTTGDYSTWINWMWKRAPSFFDVVAYTGTGSAMTINHNLGVTPEMIWTKRRDSTGSWIVYHSATGLNNYLLLNSTAAAASAGNYYAVSDTTFGAPFVNSGGTFISYLFASVDGVSKVGSYTGDGTTGRVIDCGFSSGARFVLIKVTSHTGDWWVFDTERGITTSVAYGLRLNDTAAEVPSGSPTQDYHDRIDPSSSGFIVNHTSAIGVNESGKDYIFYAIA